MTGDPLDRIAIDVQAILDGIGDPVVQQRVSLHSYLITRPTGRAVRMAIEAQLPGPGRLSVSVIDFSEVRLIDFSCADEVVAKLLLAYRREEGPDAFFVFRGIGEAQEPQVLAVLERQALAAVVQTPEGVYELVGVHSDAERAVWARMEDLGTVDADGVDRLVEVDRDEGALDRLVARGLVFRAPDSGRLHALSRLVRPAS